MWSHREGCVNSRETGGSRRSVQITHSKQDNRRGKNTEQEVFQRRFLSGRIPSRQQQKQVGWNADQFEGDEQSDQIIGRRDQVHPGENGEQASMTFRRTRIICLIPVDQHENRSEGQRQPTDVPCQFVQNKRSHRAGDRRALIPDKTGDDQRQQG